MSITWRVCLSDAVQFLMDLPSASAQACILDPPHQLWPEMAAPVLRAASSVVRDGYVMAFCRLSDVPALQNQAAAERWQLQDALIWYDPQPVFVSQTRVLRCHEHIMVWRAGNAALPRMDVGAWRDDIEPVSTKGQLSHGTWTANGRMYQPKPRAHLTSVLTFPRPLNGPLGRWQKPEPLIEMLVEAFTCAGDTVVDPFSGSGTTGVVAVRHGRNFVGCELNPQYVELARRRIGAVAPLFATEVA